jgi:hypothetical protein
MGPIGCPQRQLEIITARCEITQENAVLIYFVAEVWNQAKYSH